MDGIGFLWILIFTVLGIVIWYFLNRASVKANRQVELLEQINKKLAVLIPDDASGKIEDHSGGNYLDEARKKVGL